MFRSGTDLDMTVKLLFTLLYILFRFHGSEMLIHICFSSVEIVSFTMTDMNWYHPDMVGGHWNWSTSRPGMLDDLSVKYRQCPSSTKLLALEWLVSVDTKHRALQSDSNKRFCTRGFACRAFILGHGESKKSCLNYCRNRSSNHLPSRGSNPGPLREQLLDKIFSSRLYIIDFRETCSIQHLRYFIVRSFLA